MSAPTSMKLLVAVALVLGFAPLAPAGAVDGDANGPTLAGELVVEFAPSSDSERRLRALAAGGLELVEEAPGSRFALVRPRAGAVRAAAVEAEQGIVSVRPPARFNARSTPPNDPLFQYQWHLGAVQVPEAWAYNRGRGATVAVLDSGVAYENFETFRRAPDLAGTTFVAGYDFVDDDTHPNDNVRPGSTGHGTHVAGTIAQTTNNGMGSAGVAPEAAIMPVRVLDTDGGGNDFDIARGLRFAADNGAHVANLSLGGPTGSPVLADAVTYAANKGVTIVSVTGNSGLDTDEPPVEFPGAYPEVLAVGAVVLDESLALYSNTGPGVDLVGPGGAGGIDQDGDGIPEDVIQQTIRDSPSTFCYCPSAGTSNAAPHVAAAAALLVASGKATTPAEVRAALKGTAKDLGPAGHDSDYGAGLVQAADALASVGAPLASPGPRNIGDACPPGTVPGAGFGDVAGSDVHRTAIDCVVWWDVANGLSSSRFGPTRSVTRDQMASFIARLIEESGGTLPANPPNAFGDDNGSVHETRINQLAAAGIVAGTGTGTYGPRDVVRRDQMASFLVRAYEFRSATTLVAGTNAFGDDDGNVHEASINKAAAVGFTGGTTATSYSPTADVPRNAMSSFLARVLDKLVEDDGAALPT